MVFSRQRKSQKGISSVQIASLRTPIVKRGDSLPAVIYAALQALSDTNLEKGGLEGKILAVTSKIVSVCENQIVPRSEVSKTELIRRQADRDLGEIGYGSRLTVKENLLLASAGIDESNSETDDFICLPKNSKQSAFELWNALRSRFQLKSFGVVITDSRTSPLRLGTTGVSLSHWGFDGLKDRVGQPDLFGRPLQVTKVNLVDALAAAAVLVMGEGEEQTPLALISELPENMVTFHDSTDVDELRVKMVNGEFPTDLYWPFLAPGFRR
jgi:F420-0:gamma-glutamyl ligase